MSERKRRWYLGLVLMGSVSMVYYLSLNHGMFPLRLTTSLQLTAQVRRDIVAFTDDERTMAAGFEDIVMENNNATSSLRSAKLNKDVLNDTKLNGFNILEYRVNISAGNIVTSTLLALTKGRASVYIPGYGTKAGNLSTFHNKLSFYGMLYQGGSYFDPYHHFGGDKNWTSRDLSPILVNQTNGPNFVLSNWKTPTIQIGISNGMVNKGREETSKLDLLAPPAIIPTDVFAPLSSTDILFRYDALWAVLLHVLSSPAMCDMLRGFWIQRILWESGNNVGFFPSKDSSVQGGGSTIVGEGLGGSNDNCTRVSEIVKFLSTWQCPNELSFFECIVNLSKNMEGLQYLSKDNVMTIERWLKDLNRVGYKQPKRKEFRKLKYRAEYVQEEKIKFQTDTSGPFVNLTYTSRTLSTIVDPRSLKRLEHVCKNFSKNIAEMYATSKVKQEERILLIVVFNFPYYSNVAYLETMYRPHFKHIVYCGEQIERFKKETRDIGSLPFIEARVYMGYFGQRCLVHALHMNYDVDGYLYIGDDILVNTWRLAELPKHRLWTLNLWPMQHNKRNSSWIWVENRSLGRAMYKQAILSSQHRNKTRFETFFQNLASNTGEADGYYGGRGDIVYVPRRFRRDCAYFLDHLSRFNLFMEIALPTVLCGLDRKENIHRLSGRYVGTTARQYIETFFKQDRDFLHPFKLSEVTRSTNGSRFLCSQYIPLSLQTSTK